MNTVIKQKPVARSMLLHLSVLRDSMSGSSDQILYTWLLASNIDSSLDCKKASFFLDWYLASGLQWINNKQMPGSHKAMIDFVIARRKDRESNRGAKKMETTTAEENQMNVWMWNRRVQVSLPVWLSMPSMRL